VEIEADNLFLAKRAIAGSHRAAQQASGDSSSAARKRVFVDGKLIPANRVIGKEGVEYVGASVLREALGASVQPGDSGVMIHSAAKPDEGDKGSRAVVLKHEKVDIDPRFDEIDQQPSLAMSHVQTGADSVVYYTHWPMPTTRSPLPTASR
jgi:hypothetical protein